MIKNLELHHVLKRCPSAPVIPTLSPTLVLNRPNDALLRSSDWMRCVHRGMTERQNIHKLIDIVMTLPNILPITKISKPTDHLLRNHNDAIKIFESNLGTSSNANYLR